MHDSYAIDYIILVIISVLIGLLAATYDELLIHLLNFYRWIININSLYIPLLTTSGIFIAYITVLKIGKIKRTGSGAHDILHYIIRIMDISTLETPFQRLLHRYLRWV